MKALAFSFPLFTMESGDAIRKTSHAIFRIWWSLSFLLRVPNSESRYFAGIMNQYKIHQ